MKKTPKYGSADKLPKLDYVHTLSDMEQLKQLKKEKQALESALAQAHLRNAYLESLVSVAEEEYGVQLKKNQDKSYIPSPPAK